MLKRMITISKAIQKTANLMVGMPDYDNYLTHMRQHHPDKIPMSYKDFFRQRQQARYGKGSSRCC